MHRVLKHSDLTLDPFPFGGGVTMLESLSQNTPFITFPKEQSVLNLGDGFYRLLEARNGTREAEEYDLALRSNLVFDDFHGFVSVLLAQKSSLQTWLWDIRQRVSENKHYLFEGEEEVQASVDEFVDHLQFMMKYDNQR